ncbi:1-phosphofructokinase [Alteribacter aurantiacus]|uniref:1-phosphofructokinase n=1 Tax=Alteribacter aurantiacus TaxID=254410 RepID=UPI0004007D39|nr:1-phosphofructokinase [Alteribacter aurantiacus]
MIYTVTLNPSADYLLELPQLQVGETNRATSSKIVSGGKGINVAEVLSNVSVPVKALGFLAGFTGAFVKEEVERKGIQSDFIFTEGLTRINVKVKADGETEINGQGPVLSEIHLSQLEDQLSRLTQKDILVLSGSVPSGVSIDFYKKLGQQASKRGVKVVLDSSGEALREGLGAKPFLIKPNKAELMDLYKQSINDLDDALLLGRKAVRDGAENVMISLGSKGALFVNEHDAFVADAPEGNLVNSVGAGDSMVAGFLYAFANEKNLKDSFRYSVAAGSATAFSKGFCTKNKIDELAATIAVQSI